MGVGWLCMDTLYKWNVHPLLVSLSTIEHGKFFRRSVIRRGVIDDERNTVCLSWKKRNGRKYQVGFWPSCVCRGAELEPHHRNVFFLSLSLSFLFWEVFQLDITVEKKNRKRGRRAWITLSVCVHANHEMFTLGQKILFLFLFFEQNWTLAQKEFFLYVLCVCVRSEPYSAAQQTCGSRCV